MEQIRVLDGSPEYIEADKDTIESIIQNRKVNPKEAKEFFKKLNKYDDLQLKLEIDIKDPKPFLKELFENEDVVGLLLSLSKYNDTILQHSCRLATYSTALTELLGLKKDKRHSIYTAAILHDVGKMALPHELWTKKIKPTAQDAKLMRGHTLNGYNILKSINEEEAIVALQHHERISGCGYPYQLKDKEIEYNSKMVAVLDVFDVMSIRRSYSLTRYQLPTIYKFFDLYSNDGKKNYEGTDEELEKLINFFGDEQLFDNNITKKFLELFPKGPNEKN